VAHAPRKIQFDFTGDPVLDPGPGIYEGILPLRCWQTSRVLIVASAALEQYTGKRGK